MKSSHDDAINPTLLEQPLLYFSKEDIWRVRDACEGVQIFGAIGSGKTSGSGQAIAKAFLKAGFGGLVLTAKPDERAQWERYCRDTGRINSLVVFSPEQPFRFNFLDYELRRPGKGAGLTENLVNIFYAVLETAERAQNRGGDSYWQHTLKQLLRNMIDLLAIARGTVSLPDMYNLLTSAPLSNAQLHDKTWQENSFCYQCVQSGEEKEKTPMQQNDFAMSARYWCTEFPNLAEKTRSVIMSSFTSMADSFLRGMLRELFCTTTNLVPELTHEGAIVVVDLPVKQYAEVGKYAQIIMKYIWQQAVERRDTAQQPKPVFLWADEAQNFVTSYDMQFQATARSSRACTVYISQNLPNYYAELGGEQAGKSRADALLGNFQTKVFHANSEPVTNTWAADLIAKSLQYRGNRGSTRQNEFGVDIGGRHTTTSSYEVVEYDVMPQEFTHLKKGGPENGLETEAFVFQGGRRWKATGKNHLKAVFKQDIQ